MVNEFHPDHIILGFIYPDAVALAPFCRKLQLDYSVLVLGSDFRLRTRQSKFKNLVMTTLHKSPLIFCPGLALKDDMTTDGIEGSKIIPFNNGVDCKLFYPQINAD